ncbi:MAG TPA: GIY-YIG nuclease family protein [Rhodoglobus sp.]|nr:GIY-YIG nuclease family protein [Rhodoglobus sp.]
MRCAIPGCAAAAALDDLPLCDDHLEQAHAVVERDRGGVDVLPSPCPACASRLGVHYPSGWLCAVCEWRYGEAPAESTPPRVDVVYYLRHGDRIKIGTTANPRTRFAALTWEELLGFERGDRTVERRRHEQFAELRFPGSEWFRAEPPLIEHVERVRAGVGDPWALHARWVSEAVALRAQGLPVHGSHE